MKEKFKPKFIIIPYKVCEDERLREIDKILYGIISYFKKMKQKKCIASNESLRDYCHVKTIRTIQASLERLEQCDHIKREYKKLGKAGTGRIEIVCLSCY